VSNINKINILIVIMGRYPTEKAYGVTTKYTIEAIRALGGNPYVVSFQDFENGVQEPQTIAFSEGKLAHFFRLNSYKGFGPISIICWKLTLYFALRQLPAIVSNINPSIIWMRDSRIMRFVKGFGNQTTYILEIHDGVNESILRKLLKEDPTKVLLAPISKIIESQLKNRLDTRYKIVHSPMGINPDLFISENEIRNFNNVSNEHPLRLGYFGKFAPNGYSKGVEELLELVIFHHKIDYPSRVQIAGLTRTEKLHITTLFEANKIPKNKYKLDEHLAHEVAISEMQKCDVLVLPGQGGPYVGSPIKGVEYCATGRPIVAAISDANLSLYAGEFEPFWYENADVNSLHQAILGVSRSQDLEERAQKSIKFAQERTWVIRTSRLIDSINLLATGK